MSADGLLECVRVPLWSGAILGQAGQLTPDVFAAVGAAYGTSKAGIGIAGMGTLRPELIMKVRTRPARSHPRSIAHG